MALLIVPIGIRFIVSDNQKDLVSTYEGKWEHTDKSKIEECMNDAKDYNEALRETGIINQKEYKKQLNLLGNGVMCSLEIPKINLKLPVYHGISEEVLSNGIGHMIESSLPTGGSGTHSILSGHRGLSGAELFTRLDEMKKGDLFFVIVCNQRLGYQVSEIQVVEPEDTSCIQIQENKDLASLVTCTPYGLNTHRLVVTGERIFEWTQEETVAHQKVSGRDKLYFGIPCAFLIVMAINKVKNTKKRKKMKNVRMILPLFLLGISLILPLEASAMENKVEIQLPSDYRENLVYTKVGEKIDGQYVLEKEYQRLGVDLNQLNTAKDMREAAIYLSEHVWQSTLIPIDENGYGEVDGLEDGVYLVKGRRRQQREVQPILIFLPGNSETGDEIFRTVEIIPKFYSEKPKTGWDSDEAGYGLLMTLSFGFAAVCCRHKYSLIGK